MGFFLPHRSRRVFSIFKFSKLSPFSDFFEASSRKKKNSKIPINSENFRQIPMISDKFRQIMFNRLTFTILAAFDDHKTISLTPRAGNDTAVRSPNNLIDFLFSDSNIFVIHEISSTYSYSSTRICVSFKATRVRSRQRTCRRQGLRISV